MRISDWSSDVCSSDLLAPQDLLEGLAMRPGVLGRHAPDPRVQDDIRRGVAVLRALGPADVGQAVVVQQGIVLALEAVEGTDAMLARAGGLRREGPGGALVKIAKRGQEARIDAPVIGIDTVRNAAAGGLCGIAAGAAATLVVDRDEVAAAADEAGDRKSTRLNSSH